MNESPRLKPGILLASLLLAALPLQQGLAQAPATDAPAAAPAPAPVAPAPAPRPQQPRPAQPTQSPGTPASGTPARPAQPGTQQQGAQQQGAQQPAARPANVDGFRSARFGMSEAEVRRAIQSDFPSLKEGAVKKESNALEQTEALSATVPDLLPNSQPAQVSYIFGHKTKKLIQVNILWAYPAASARAASNAPGANAAALRNYFLEQGWKRDTLAADVQLSDGLVLVFRGADEKNRQVQLLLLAPQAPQEGAEKKPGQDGFLRLSYIENPTEPDIFRIKPGQF